MLCAGVMLGITHFTRIDTVLIIPAMIATGLLWLILSRNISESLVFWLSYAVTAATLAVLYGYVIRPMLNPVKTYSF